MYILLYNISSLIYPQLKLVNKFGNLNIIHHCTTIHQLILSTGPTIASTAQYKEIDLEDLQEIITGATTTEGFTFPSLTKNLI